MTRFTLFIIGVSLFLVSCGPNTEAPYPDDLEGKQALLTDKKKELKELQAEIEQLKDEVDELNPIREKRKKIVSTAAIERKEFKKYIDVQGNVVSEDMVNASSAVGGRILRLYVKEGQAINRGATIASIDMETTQNQLRELEISLDLSKTVYERQERLWKQNIGSEIQYLEAKANKDRIEKSIETLQSQLAKRKVYAPISGVIDKEYMSAGEMIGPGTPIVSILNTYKVKVVVDLPESYLGIIKKGDYVDLKIPAIEKEMKAKVTLIGRTIDPANRTFKVEVDLKNKKGDLKPNLLAEMRINELTEKNAIVLPLSLIQEEVSGKRYVYIAESEGDTTYPRKKYIEIGESYNDEVVIAEGLNGDEIIIVQGARNIIENEPITISNVEEKSE